MAGRLAATWGVALLVVAPSAPWLGGPAPGSVGQGLRVVDHVEFGVPQSEIEHEVEARDAAVGVDGDRVFRQVRGSLASSMRVYEDSEVVLECTVLGVADPGPALAVRVESQPVPARLPSRRLPDAVTIRVRVPFAITRGLTALRVAIHATTDTAIRVTELRTVQEHLERAPDTPALPDRAGGPTPLPHGMDRGGGSPPPGRVAAVF